MDRGKINTILCAIIAAIITWYLNHEMGYGAIVANGLVGVVGAILLPGALAGANFTASFIGMSSTAVIPSIAWAGIGGLVVGIVIAYSPEVYAGIGGKGGTTAACSVQITRVISSFFR